MDPLDPPEVLPPKAASALPEQREDDSWDKRTAPHAAHSGPPSHTPRETEHPLATHRGHAAKHGHASDRKAAAPGHGGRHLPPTDIQKATKRRGGRGGWGLKRMAWPRCWMKRSRSPCWTRATPTRRSEKREVGEKW